MVKSAVEAFIDGHGAAAIAAAAGKSVSAVRVWRYRHIIPRSAWPELTAQLDGLTIADLVEIEALSEPFARRRKAVA